MILGIIVALLELRLWFALDERNRERSLTCTISAKSKSAWPSAVVYDG